MDADNIQFTRIETQIAKHMFKHFKDRYNSRQLGRVLGINHAHANKLCNGLAKKLILKKEEIGNGVYFTFDYDSKPAMMFITYLLTLEQSSSPRWLTTIAHSLRKFDQHVELSLIFGSAVKNSRFNDIDVLLVYEKSKMKAISKIKDEIRNSRLVPQPIRYLDITESDLYLNKKDPVFYNILSDCLVINDAGKYVEVVRRCHR